MSHRTSRTIDVILLLWLLLWCVVGFALARRVNELSGLSDGVIGAGEGVSDAANALGGFADVPIVGGGLDAIAEQIDAIGQGAVRRGEASKAAIFNVSLLIGLVVALDRRSPLSRCGSRSARRSPATDAGSASARRRGRRPRGLPGPAGRDPLFVRTHLGRDHRSMGRPAVGTARRARLDGAHAPRAHAACGEGQPAAHMTVQAQPQRSESRNARNFRSVSSSSFAGSESATMPAPAKRVARSSWSAAQRSASANTPSPRASTQPTGPA